MADSFFLRRLRCYGTCKAKAMADRVTKTRKRPPARSVSTHMERNVRAIAKLERDAMAERTPADRLSDSIARVAGSAGFVAFHLVLFTAWISINIGKVRP